MRTILASAVSAVLLVGLAAAPGQPRQSKTVADSINYIWKDEARDFVALAEVMPEDRWGFRPTGWRVLQCAYFRRAGQTCGLCQLCLL